MAEMSFTLYVKSSLPDEHEKVGQLIDTINKYGGKEWDVVRPMMESIVSEINTEKNERLLDDLINNFDEHGYGAEDFSLDNPGKYEKAGYWAFNMVFGSPGPQNALSIVRFFAGLGKTDTRGYLSGDEDPWEVFYRQINDEIVIKEYVPDESFEEDCESLESGVYAWWHDGLPNDIQEGYLNNNELDDEYIVFTGEFNRNSHKDMEELAKEFGANVQKKIDDETAFLVVGVNTEKSILSKAIDLGITMINERQFYNAIG